MQIAWSEGEVLPLASVSREAEEGALRGYASENRYFENDARSRILQGRPVRERTVSTRSSRNIADLPAPVQRLGAAAASRTSDGEGE
jgi:hypothetical protein